MRNVHIWKIVIELTVLHTFCFGFFYKTSSFTVSVILDAPTGMSSDVWALVQPELAKVTKVCVYDRAGLGFSERPSYKVSLYFSLIFVLIFHNIL